MTSEEEFNRARENESYRQPFLDSINLESEARFVHKVIYNSNQKYSSFMDENVPTIMRCKLRPLEIFGRVWLPSFRRADIYVFPIAFTEAIPNINSFLNNLIDHEGFHAKQLFFNPWLALGDGAMLELDAYWNQMISSEKRGLDDNWRQIIAGKCSRVIDPFAI